MPTSSVTIETIALTSFGMTCLPFYGSVVAERGGRRLVRPGGLAAQVLLQMVGVVAIEEMAEETAIEIGRAEEPIGDREREVHGGFHHEPGVVVRGVMAAQGVDERHVA